MQRTDPARSGQDQKEQPPPRSALTDTPAASARWLRTPDAGKHLGLAAATLEKLRVTGGGPCFAKLGRAVVYDRAELDRWAAARSFASTAAASVAGAGK